MPEPFLSWEDGYGVGHERLDGEHRGMIAAINAIHFAEHAGQEPGHISALAADLKRLAAEHFRHENGILTELNSGQIPATGKRKSFLRAMMDASVSEHLISHERSLSRLNDIICKCPSLLNSCELSFSLALKKWFTGHITRHDAQLKAVFDAMRQ